MILSIALVLSTASCQKDEKLPVSKKDALTSNSWGVQSELRTLLGVKVTMKDCRKDDVWTFSKNGIWTRDPKEAKCDSGDRIYTNTWVLSGDEKTILSDGVFVYTIKELTESKLVLYSEVPDETIETTLFAIK